jgi:tripeptide aminopeptidase
MNSRRIGTVFAAALVLVAMKADADPLSGASDVDAVYPAIVSNAAVVKTLADLKADDEATFAEQKRITEIAAPPYKEKIRAEYYLKRMQELGLKDASIDGEGNVIALRKGSGGGRPKLVVAAHLDTVFPEGTDVTLKEKDGSVVAPGIGDDARGLATLLSIINAMNVNNVATVGDVLFVGDVGEEELGNLRGCSATTPTSTGSSRSMGLASTAWSTRGPEATATR